MVCCKIVEFMVVDKGIRYILLMFVSCVECTYVSSHYEDAVLSLQFAEHNRDYLDYNCTEICSELVAQKTILQTSIEDTTIESDHSTKCIKST